MRLVKKVWHGGCKQVGNGEAPLEGAAAEKEMETEMNALIPTTKLGNVGGFGSLLVALFSMSAVFYALLTSGSVA